LLYDILRNLEIKAAKVDLMRVVSVTCDVREWENRTLYCWSCISHIYQILHCTFMDLWNLANARISKCRRRVIVSFSFTVH